MIQIIWQYVVRSEACAHFELAYGPGGAWSKLFSSAPGFRGISLLRDQNDSNRYLALEMWDSEASRHGALAEQAQVAAALETSLGQYVEARNRLGAFRYLAQAAVKPIHK